MTIANGAQHSMSYVLESTFGTTPASPTLTPLRHTGTTVGLSKTGLESAELRSDRQVKDFRHGNKNNAGDINIEMSYGSHDDFLQAAFAGTWTTQVDSGLLTIGVAPNGSGADFTRSTGSFLTDTFAAGDIITVSGFTDAGGNGRFVITNVVALVITATPIEGQTVPTEAGGADEQIICEANLRTGIVRRSFTLQRYFSDVTQYLVYTGFNFNTFSLDVAPDQIVTATFGGIGKSQTVSGTIISGATYGAETTTSPFDSFTGAIRDNGADIAVVTSLSVSLDNGMSPLFVVGSSETLQPSIARSRLTGSMTVYFEDTTILNKFINETETTLQFSLTDAAGNDYIFYMPRVKYNSGQPDVTSEDPVTLTVDFVALLDSVSGTNIVIDRVPA